MKGRVPVPVGFDDLSFEAQVRYVQALSKRIVQRAREEGLAEHQVDAIRRRLDWRAQYPEAGPCFDDVAKDVVAKNSDLYERLAKNKERTP